MLGEIFMDFGKSSTILISVIIPVYNREKEIGYCLEKLAQTTFNKRQLEILVVDDASTDNTVKEILKFEDKFCHFELLKLTENSGGASIPRNKGIREAQGEWILFVDSDDYITPYALEECYQLVDNNPNTDLVCMPYFRKEGGKRAISSSCFSYEETIEDLDFVQTKLYNSLNIVGKLIRRKLLEMYQINFPTDIRVREDNYFSMKLYAIVNKIAFLGNQKNYYFCGERDAVSLSKNGTPPRDAANIYISVFKFIFKIDTISQDNKEDILAIYLNRYFGMIQRGKYSPRRLLDEIGQNLFALKRSRFLNDDTRLFIEDLSLEIESKIKGMTFFQKGIYLQENHSRKKIDVDESLLNLFRKKRINTLLSSQNCRFKLNKDFIEVSENAVIEPYTTFATGNRFYTMGSFSYSRSNLPTNTIVGRYTSIATNVTRLQESHPMNRFTTSNITYEIKNAALKRFTKDQNKEFDTIPNTVPDCLPIVIGNDVWIGQDVRFGSKGITVGDGAVIAAGSIVTKDVPPYAVVAGVPARIIKFRFESHIIQRLLNLKWWQYPYTDFKEIRGDVKIETFIDILEKLIDEVELLPYLPEPVTIDDFIQ